MIGVNRIDRAEYRRARMAGDTWFFTVNRSERRGNRLLLDRIDTLRATLKEVRERHPFRTDAIVALPDHLHCVWTLPPGDADFSTRWGLIKSRFSRALPHAERRSSSRAKRGDRGIWQRRFGEHLIANEQDLRRHIDYIHWNPVKHGWVRCVADWPYSSFHKYVERGIYPRNWGGGDPVNIAVRE